MLLVVVAREWCWKGCEVVVAEAEGSGRRGGEIEITYCCQEKQNIGCKMKR